MVVGWRYYFVVVVGSWPLAGFEAYVFFESLCLNLIEPDKWATEDGNI